MAPSATDLEVTVAAPPLRSVLYNHIKQTNEELLTKPFIQYTVDELQEIIEDNGLAGSLIESVSQSPQRIAAEPGESSLHEEPQVAQFAPSAPAVTPQLTPQSAPTVPPVLQQGETPQQLAQRLGVPLADRGEDRAGLNFNTHDGRTQPIRVDSKGRTWFQDEVRKPSIPMPRARRVTTHISSGFKTIEKRTARGTLDEAFEVAGDEAREMRVKVTLPSWQVGTYREPSMPFLIHIYQEVRGFDLKEVTDFYGGPDHVPSTIKTIYVGNSLCYDIVSTRDTMEREYRERVLGRSRF